MVNFFSILKKAGSMVLGIEHVAVPLLSIADPALAPALSKLDTWVTRLTNGVVTVEAQVQQAKAGGFKQDAVVADVQNALADLNSGLALMGKTIQYDPAELPKLVKMSADFYNEVANFKSNWKIVDLPAVVPSNPPQG